MDYISKSQICFTGNFQKFTSLDSETEIYTYNEYPLTSSTKPEYIPGNRPVFFIINHANEGFLINDDGAYPPSNGGWTSISCTFKNNSKQVIDIYWIGTNGELQKYYSLLPANSYIQPTYEKNGWALKIHDKDWIYAGTLYSSGSVIIYSDFQVIKYNNK